MKFWSYLVSEMPLQLTVLEQTPRTARIPDDRSLRATLDRPHPLTVKRPGGVAPRTMIYVFRGQGSRGAPRWHSHLTVPKADTAPLASASRWRRGLVPHPPNNTPSTPSRSQGKPPSVLLLCLLSVGIRARPYARASAGIVRSLSLSEIMSR